MRRVAIVLVLAACGSTPAPQAPSNGGRRGVRSEIERAEQAEKARRHDVARTHYERAVAVAADPASSDLAHREFGETLAVWGEYAESVKHLEAAIAAVPGDAIAWQMLGIVRHKLGDIPGAFAALERSKALAPNAWIPRRDLAVLHWKVGHTAQALAEYRGMLDLDLPERVRDAVKWALDQMLNQRNVPASPPST